MYSSFQRTEKNLYGSSMGSSVMVFYFFFLMRTMTRQKWVLTKSCFIISLQERKRWWDSFAVRFLYTHHSPSAAVPNHERSLRVESVSKCIEVAITCYIFDHFFHKIKKKHPKKIPSEKKSNQIKNRMRNIFQFP